MPESFSRNINFRQDRAAKFPALMRRIRAHEPFTRAGLTWIVWEGLECLADHLDAEAEREKFWTLAKEVEDGGEDGGEDE